MNIIRFLPFLLLFSALALPGAVPSGARLYAKPGGAVLATLPSGAKLDVKRCTGGPKGWCSVVALGKAGYIPRAQINARGACSLLIGVGMGDLLPHEASYNGNRDRDHDRLGCDTVQ